MGGVDEHALCHSGGTPRRAAAAASEAAGGAVLWGRKPGACEIMASRASFIGVASANTPGFGSLRSVSPGAATRRGGKKLAGAAGLCRNVAGRRARLADFASGNLPGKPGHHNDFVREPRDRGTKGARPASVRGCDRGEFAYFVPSLTCTQPKRPWNSHKAGA